MTEELPDSAISSWGGFVYQGKIALFHSIKLLLDESFDGKEVKKFALQLDRALLHKDLNIRVTLRASNLSDNLGMRSA